MVQIVTPLIRIIKSWTYPDLLAQTPGAAGQWGNCRFTLASVEQCDFVIVLNHTPEEVNLLVPPENIWCFIQEPPEPEYRWMAKGARQFSRVFGPNPSRFSRRHFDTHGSLPWWVGRTYDQLQSDPPLQKTRDLSWVTSASRAKPGHALRMGFLDRIRNEVPLDLFGKGFAPIATKWEGLAPYRYSIAIENFSCSHYWTEKIADCFLAGAMPIYYGATKIAKYFPKDSFVWLDIRDPDAPRRLREIVASDLAERNRDAIREARRRVLEEHQLFPRVARLVAGVSLQSSPARHVRLAPNPDLTGYYLENPLRARVLNSIRRNIRRFARLSQK